MAWTNSVRVHVYVWEILFEKAPPAHPSVKRVPGLVLGSKAHWLCLIIY